MTTIWVSQSHSSQRDVVLGMRRAMPDATVVASHSGDREDILSCASRAVREPSRRDLPGGYPQWLLTQARQAGASLVVASRGRRDLRGFGDAFESAGIRLACGATTVASLDLAERKDLFAAALDRAGIPAPATRLVRGAWDLEGAMSDLSGRGRLCVKPATGVYGRGFWILQPDADPLQSLLDPHLAGGERLLDPAVLARALSTTRNPEPLVVMEFLPGIERSVDCVCDAGRVVAVAARAKMGSHQVVTTSGPHVDLAVRVAALLGLDGLVNVQSRDGADGSPRVLEVNTRPSGGVGYAFAAGINLPGALALHAAGRPLPDPPAGPVAIRILDAAARLDATTDALTEGRRPA